jgi:hypothetical protein
MSMVAERIPITFPGPIEKQRFTDLDRNHRAVGPL